MVLVCLASYLCEYFTVSSYTYLIKFVCTSVALRFWLLAAHTEAVSGMLYLPCAGGRDCDTLDEATKMLLAHAAAWYLLAVRV